MQLTCWSLRCSWSIACQRCSNYIFILVLTPGINKLGKANLKKRRESFQFWDLVHLIWESYLWLYADNLSESHKRKGREKWMEASKVGVTKVYLSFEFSIEHNFEFIDLNPFELCSYFTGGTTAKLWRHLSNRNVTDVTGVSIIVKN